MIVLTVTIYVPNFQPTQLIDKCISSYHHLILGTTLEKLLKSVGLGFETD
jgi:hypothetical protein